MTYNESRPFCKVTDSSETLYYSKRIQIKLKNVHGTRVGTENIFGWPTEQNYRPRSSVADPLLSLRNPEPDYHLEENMSTDTLRTGWMAYLQTSLDSVTISQNDVWNVSRVKIKVIIYLVVSLMVWDGISLTMLTEQFVINGDQLNAEHHITSITNLSLELEMG